MTFYCHCKLHLVSLVVLVLVVALVPPAILAQGRSLALTTRGPVSGLVTPDGIHAFLGIPYAAPPVGHLRWRPPVSHEHWFAFQSLAPPTPVAETNFATFHHCAFWGQLLGAP
jgi:para-nitrobenzyl esterase